MSRGTFVITQKESRGEYGALQCSSDDCVTKPEWKWGNATYDYNIYAHVFDQNGTNGDNGTPYRYNSATSFGSNVCTNDMQTTHGSTTYSSINNQISCSPNSFNAGNWYSFPAATAGSDMSSRPRYPDDAPNSICPKGWQLPPNEDNPNETKKSYNNLIRTAYSISVTNSDSGILASPLSFVRLGYYYYGYGSLYARGSNGDYWSSTAYNGTGSRGLGFSSELLNPQGGSNRAHGFSVRCVSRDSR